MTMTPQPEPAAVYRPLPGRAKRMFGMLVNDRQRLWLADDHILVATQSYYYERYKRFYLKDIQALTIQKTAAGAVYNIFLLFFAALFGSLAMTGVFMAWAPGAQIALAVIAGIFGCGALINVALGPTCQFHVLTAVHEEQLFCLGRLYTAQRVIEYLREIVESIQGTVGDLGTQDAGRTARVEKAADKRELLLGERSESGTLHVALFVLLCVDATLAAISLVDSAIVPMAVGLLSTLGILGLSIAAAIRQRNTDVPRAVRTTTWTALVYNAIMAMVMLYMSVMIQTVQQMREADADAIASGMERVYLLAGNSTTLLFNLGTGVVGLYLVFRWRNAARIQQEQARVDINEGGDA